MQFSDAKYWKIFLISILFLIFLPVILLLGPIIGGPILLIVLAKDKCCDEDHPVIGVLLVCCCCPFVLVFGAVIGALALAFLYIPAFFFQLFRVIRMSYRRCKCCIK